MNNMSDANSDSPSQNRDLYQVDVLGLLRRKLVAILFFLICCTGLSVLYYFKAPKTFESWARVYIDDKRAPTMTVDGEIVQNSSVEKYIEIITSRAVLAEAIDACDVDNMRSLSSVDDTLYYVRENLYAKPSDTRAASGVMKLRFQSEVEEDCQIVLTNILTSFDRFIRQGSEDQGSDMLETITQLEKERKETFTNLMVEIDQLMKKPFIQVIDGKVYNQYQGQASKLQEELDLNASEKLRFVALRDNLIQAKLDGKRIEDLVVDLIKDMNEGQLGGYTATHDKYLELKVQEKEMAGEFGDDHPKLQNVRQQIEMVDRMRKEQMISAIRNSIGEIGDGDFYTVVKSYVDNKINFFDSHEEQLQAAINQSKFKSLEIAKDCERLSRLLIERDMLANSNVEMRDLAQEYNVLSNYDWQDVRVIDPASKAEQVAPDLLISIASGIMLGLISGFGFALLKELAEKTFRSSDDITKQLGIGVVAQIPKFEKRRPKDSEYKNIAADLVSLHAPQSQVAEAFKALRTSVFFRAKQDPDMKVIQITSPTAGDGKSVVSSNLAVAMAQAGRRVLLIDCDLRRQTQHQRFGVGNHVGVTSVISGESDFAGAVQATSIKNLDLLASGPPCGNPAEILISEDFANLIQDTRDNYDFVIVDTPPVLPVTDPAIICNLVDAVYMPMRIRKGVQVKAQKATEALAMVGCELAGIVINGLSKREAGSYSYGGYGTGNYAKYGAYRSAKPVETNSTPGKLQNVPTSTDPNVTSE